MLYGLLLFKFVYRESLGCIGDLGYFAACDIFEQCIYAAAVSVLINVTPPNLPLAGLGVFAGRAFKKDDVVLLTWMTLFLPHNFPLDQEAWNYIFDHNETHSAMVLDYGSIANHHESANTKAFRFEGFENVHFHVRRVRI